jgi:hypothetical protein
MALFPQNSEYLLRCDRWTRFAGESVLTLSYEIALLPCKSCISEKRAFASPSFRNETASFRLPNTGMRRTEKAVLQCRHT